MGSGCVEKHFQTSITNLSHNEDGKYLRYFVFAS